MSDMAEYYEEQRRAEQKKKAQRLKDNTDLMGLLSVDLGFRYKIHSEHHFSLYHKAKGRLDYWPSTGKAMWVFGHKRGKAFMIHNLENFLLTNFK